MRVFGLLLPFLFAAPAWAAPPLPWDQDRAVLVVTHTGVTTANAKSLEAALKHGARFFPNGAVADGKQYVLIDGGTEEMLVNLAAAAESKRPGPGQVSLQPVANFYPDIALTLARFYSQHGRPADAVRVLDAGLALSPAPEGAVGAHVAAMMAAKGAALVTLRQVDQALDIYDQALASHVLTDADRAMLKRGQAQAKAMLRAR